MTFFPTIKIKFNCPVIQLFTPWLCYSFFPKFFLWFWFSVRFFPCYSVSPQKQGPRFQQKSCSISVYWVELSIRHLYNEVNRFVCNYTQTRQCYLISELGNRFQLMADDFWIVAKLSIAMRRIPDYIPRFSWKCAILSYLHQLRVYHWGDSVLYVFHSCWKKNLL